MRQLATVRRINDLLPIEGADLIMTAVIDGWNVVVKKDEFKVNDLCIYFEIDSFLPDGHDAWQHLVEKHPRIFEGARGHRLKTVRLRGQVSQGFAAPVNKFINDFIDSDEDEGQEISEYFFVGNDLSALLNIKKYETPIPSELAGKVHGNFPSCIPRTDQQRCQNIGYIIFTENAESRYERSMKMDGASFTGYRNGDHTGVCSRNWELSLHEENASNSLVRMFVDSNLQNVLLSYGKNYAIQGELMGPAIQANREQLSKIQLFVFDIYDIDNTCYLEPDRRKEVLEELYDHGLDTTMVVHSPVLAYDVTLGELGISNVAELLKSADGPSIKHPVKEGDVYKRMDGKFSFKVISNLYLLKEKD